MQKRFFVFVSTLVVVAAFAVGLIVHASFGKISKADLAVNSCEASGFCETHATPTSTAPLVAANATVVRVIDGDTFVARLDGEMGEWTIRMLGIDTPETVDPRREVECFGKEASATLSRLLDGKRVRLESDNQADERDKYGRLLRNVILEDGTDVNALLVREGYAHAYLSFSLDAKRKKELSELEAIAKASESGLWSESACPVHSGL